MNFNLFLTRLSWPDWGFSLVDKLLCSFLFHFTETAYFPPQVTVPCKEPYHHSYGRCSAVICWDGVRSESLLILKPEIPLHLLLCSMVDDLHRQLLEFATEMVQWVSLLELCCRILNNLNKFRNASLLSSSAVLWFWRNARLILTWFRYHPGLSKHSIVNWNLVSSLIWHICY